MRFAGLTALPSRAMLALSLPALAVVLSAETTRLKLGHTISSELAEGQTHSYSIKLKANQYFRAVVTQLVASVAIELDGPGGKKALEVDTRNFPGRSSRIVWVAETTGEYRISLRGAGRFEITLEELRKAQADDGKRVEADRLFIQGLSQTRDQAIAIFAHAADLYRGIQDHEREGDALTAEGSAYRDAGQSDQAIAGYEQARAVRMAVNDRRGEALTLSALGIAYYNIHEYEKAVDYQQRSLSIAREIKDRAGEAAALKNLGNAHSGLSQSEKAIEEEEQALAIFREIKDSVSAARALNNLATGYQELSQYEKAIGYYEQALAVFRDAKNRRAEGVVLLNLALSFESLRLTEKALIRYEEALAIFLQIGDRGLEGSALTGIGWSYTTLGQNEKARRYYEESLAIEKDLKDKTSEVMTLIDMGTNSSDEQQSIVYYAQALAIAREIKNRKNEGLALEELGWSSLNLKQFVKAIDYEEQALAIERDVKDRQGEGETLQVLGAAYSGLRQFEKATAYYARALAVSREVKDRTNEALELSGLMDTWRAAGRPRLAVFYGKQAVNTVQSMRSDVSGLGQDLQRSFLKANEKPYHTLTEILIAEGRLAEAEQVLALLKEEEFFQYIRRDAEEASSLNRRAEMTPEEAGYEKRYREIGDRLMRIGVNRGELLSKNTLTPEQSERLAQLEQDLAAGNSAFERFLDDLTEHLSAKPEMSGRIEMLRETQGMMEDLRDLPAGTVAIFTLIGDDKVHAILRTPDAQKAYEYPITAADLNRKIHDFRQAIQDPTLDPRPLAQELYQILIGGMADDLRQAKAQTLMWSLDGALRYVPLAALYDGKQYLIEQYRVSVMTLASNARLKERPDQDWKAAGFGVTKGYEDAIALPSVSAELTGIFKILGGEIKLDGQFTQQSMRQTLLKRYPVVHIASHFRFQPGNDTKSFLLLGDGGHLTLAELKTSANLFGGVQLLTLSACNTGVGDGSEVEGFGTLAQRQGAKAVVASLWPVADESTSLLMQAFYRIRESSAGMTKLEALREAQLALLRGEAQGKAAVDGDRGVVPARAPSVAPSFPRNTTAPYAHPYYWAPFFLMGNWL